MSFPTFKPHDRRAGVYFNDRVFIFTFESLDEDPRSDDDVLIRAIRAARDEFIRVYEGR